MEIERRERNPDTGEITPLVGGGFGDVIGKIAAKLTGKTASKLATKAAEKLVEKGAEKIGEKTGQLVGEKIYDKFSAKPSTASPASGAPPEIKGKEIGKMLAAASPPERALPERALPAEFRAEAKRSAVAEHKFTKIKNVYAELL